MNNANTTLFHHIHEDNSKLSYTLKSGEEKTYVFLLTPKTSLHVDITIVLRGKYAKATLYGIVLPQKNTEVHLLTRQIHESAYSTSSFLLRSLLLYDSLVSYKGSIYIGKKARMSDAFQQHDSMLLSSHARVQTRPILEILQNDVSCKHGATIHPIPEDSLWYAKTRTLSQKQAESVYVNGFIQKIISMIPDTRVQTTLKNQCARRINAYD